MLSKRGFGGVWSMGVVLCLVFSVMLLATVPLMAQDKSLEEKLEEAKAAIEDQEWVIKQLEKNFFKVVAELNEELDFLRALSGEQLEEIDSYLKEIASLKLASAELEAAKDLLQTLRDAYWKAQVKLAEKDRELAFFEEETANLDKEIASIKAEAAELEAANARLRRHRLLLGLGFIAAAYCAVSGG